MIGWVGWACIAGIVVCAAAQAEQAWKEHRNRKKGL